MPYCEGMARVFAAADVGSNTVHLLVAGVDGARVSRLRNESEWLSLGEIVSREGRIPPAEEARLIGVLKSYRATATSFKAEGLYVFATEAMRLASNHDQVIERVQREAGVTIELITPRREAELSRLGSTIDTPVPSPAGLIEVGGGSAQVARCDDEAITDEASLPLGTGRLIAAHGLTQPSTPDQVARLTAAVRAEAVRVAEFGPVECVVASGGVARGLWRALHPDGDKSLAREELEYAAWAARRLSIDAICGRFGVKAKRAATLLPGATVFLELLSVLGQDTMRLSEFGVREGAVLEMARGRLEAACRA